MLFDRRIPANWKEKLRIALWPRRSWLRSAKYITKRILRLTGSPHAIAAGVAAGVFASFTPFMGFHFIFAGLLAYIIAGNVLASAMGTFFGNPLSFPIIWASTFSAGNFVLHRNGSADEAVSLSSFNFSDFWANGWGSLGEQFSHIWNPVLKPMLVGSIPVGVPVALAFYVATRWLAVKFRDARMRRLEARAQLLRAAEKPEAGCEKSPSRTAAQ